MSGRCKTFVGGKTWLIFSWRKEREAGHHFAWYWRVYPGWSLKTLNSLDLSLFFGGGVGRATPWRLARLDSPSLLRTCLRFHLLGKTQQVLQQSLRSVDGIIVERKQFKWESHKNAASYIAYAKFQSKTCPKHMFNGEPPKKIVVPKGVFHCEPFFQVPVFHPFHIPTTPGIPHMLPMHRCQSHDGTPPSTERGPKV